MGNLVAIAIVVLLAMIVLKVSKKIIGITLILLAVVLLMRYAVPLVM